MINNFNKIEEDYEKIKIDFQKKDNGVVVREVAQNLDNKEFVEKFNFLIKSFEGQLRRDGRTPLVFHSVYLTRLLHLFGCNEETLKIAAFHDVLEDTQINDENFNKLWGGELVGSLKILKEDTSLSREPDGKTLPERYREHIGRIMGAKKEVINVEIGDRFCDLMDLDYIEKLPEKERELRLKSKIIKVKSFVENITRNREDFNKELLKLFNYKLKQIEDKWGITADATLL